ncbi:hypothetical protein [Ilyomonas limi]|jgi:hypothetical protein|nr:hypothetical protein [Ilyomonas limi]
MNSIKDLIFDREIVSKLRQAKMTKEMLYNHLSNGRITLQEYLIASRNLA